MTNVCFGIRTSSKFFFNKLNRGSDLNLLKNINVTYSRNIPFIKNKSIVPVPIKSMAPNADFLIASGYKNKRLKYDTWINKREEIINKYQHLFSTRKQETIKYLDDVSSTWNPVDKFSDTPRWPMPLLPLSEKSSKELEDLSLILEKLQITDQFSSLRQDQYQDDERSFGVLTMPIKLPGDSDVFLPSNLQNSLLICEIVRNAAAAIEGIESVLKDNCTFQFKKYWMYCTVHIKLDIQPGEAMRERTIHVDGMMGANKNTGEVPLWPKQHLIFANLLPTNYYTHSWSPPLTYDGKPDYSKNWFNRMDRHCKHIKKEKKECIANQMYLISPYLLHETPLNNTGRVVNRLFVRIGFCNTHYNGPNYTINKRLGQFRGLEDRAAKNRPIK